MLKLTLQYFGHLMQRTDSSEKTLMLGKIEGSRRRGRQRRWLDGITESMDMNLNKLWEFGNVPGSLACCSPCRCKESDTTEQLNWTDSNNSINQWEVKPRHFCLLQFSQGGEIGDSWGKEGVLNYRNLHDLSHRKTLEFPNSVSSQQEVSLQGCARRNSNDKCHSWYVLGGGGFFLRASHWVKASVCMKPFTFQCT